MKTVCFHIGSPKTGTSALQHFLWHQSEDLARCDISYPHNATGGTLLSFANAYSLLHQRPQSIFDFVHQSSARTVIFSEEAIFLNKGLERIEEIASCLTEHEISVVVYIRNAPEYLCSLWAEYNKLAHHIYPGTLESFVSSDVYYDDLLYLLRFMRTHPNIRIIVRPYINNAHDRTDIVADFLQIFGAQPTSQGPGNLNPTPTRQAIDVFQMVVANYAEIKFQSLDVVAGLDVNFLVHQIQSGDRREIIETLDDVLICEIAGRHQNIIDALFQHQSFSHFPKCYGIKRSPYIPLDTTDVELIQDWINIRRRTALAAWLGEGPIPTTFAYRERKV